MFQGLLGERRRLPGRSGPPGADSKIRPQAKGAVTENLAGDGRKDDAKTLAAIAGALPADDFARGFGELRRAAFLRDVA